MLFKSRILGCLIVVMFTSSAFAQELLIRGHVAAPDGTEIGFSVPVQVLEALKTSGLSAMVQDQEKFCELVDCLVGDIASMKGGNLLEFRLGKVEANIAVEEVNGEHPEEANFINVDIVPADKNQPEIHFSLPKGFLFLGAFIGNQFMEEHGEALMGMLQQHIMMNCMPPMPPMSPQAMKGECCAPDCPAKSSCDSKDQGEIGEEKECEEELNLEEIQEEIQKEVDPEQIKKQILKALLEALQ